MLRTEVGATQPALAPVAHEGHSLLGRETPPGLRRAPFGRPRPGLRLRPACRPSIVCWTSRLLSGAPMGPLGDGFTFSAQHRKQEIVSLSTTSAGRLPSDIGQDNEDILRGFDLLTADGHLCNAALVLFAKPRPIGHRLFQCTLQLARFKGTDKTEFLDQLHAEGGAFHLLSDALMFIRRHMPVAARITPRQVEREETPLIPLDAVRETLINALIHRDYADPGGSLQVAIYDDRMEIWNPGRLPNGIRLEQLKSAHKSIRRNRRIADAFFRTGHIEMWGRGTQAVVDLCAQAGRKEPSFTEEERHFGVTFLAPFKATPEASLVADGLVITPLQKQILALLDETPTVSLQHAEEKTGAARRTVQRALQELVKADLIVGEGASQKRVYRRT